MKTEEVVARFDDRKGFAIVDYLEVGLPVYRMMCTALMQTQKPYAPIDEFVLRCIHIGLTSPEDIAGILGISGGVVEATLTRLIRGDDVFERANGSVELTPKGSRAAVEHKAIRPVDQSVVFHVDGLTREPQWIEPRVLLTPKQADVAGLKQIQAFPARRPEVEELNVSEVFDAIRSGAKSQDENRQLLRIKEITRTDRLFNSAVLLIFKAERGDEVQVGFVIDGRLSAAHEMAFLKAKGLEKLRIKQLILRTDIPRFEDVMSPGFARLIQDEERRCRKEAEDLRKRSALARFKAEVAVKKASRSSSKDSVRGDVGPGASEDFEVRKIQGDLAKLPVRSVAVYEHPVLLRDALRTAKEKLLIVSPWITPAVVGREFLKELREALARGVELYIGYGLGEGGANGATEKLDELATHHSNFHFKRLGDTHAKVLIKDDDYFVITSFNWLSFRGDPKRTFREEYGTFVAIPEKVVTFFHEVSARFV